jgi:predicted amidohydrolase YtcJ
MVADDRLTDPDLCAMLRLMGREPAQAELLLQGGQVHTLDPSRLAPAQAIAFGGGRVLAVGSDDELRRLRGPGTRCLELAGRTVVPGFCDCHVHLCELALAARQIDAAGCGSAEEVAGRVARHAAEPSAGRFLLGRGFDPNLWPSPAWPDRRLLDEAAPGRPVVLFSKDMHSAWLSSEALARAGIDATSRDPEGGVIRRDASGEPTGVLHERALEVIQRALPEPDVGEAASALAAVFPRAWAEGLTAIHEIHDSPGGLALSAFEALRREGRLGLRVLQYLPAAALGAARAADDRLGRDDPWLRIGGIKLFVDGALGSRTAWMLDPYLGSDDRGVAALAPDELRRTLSAAEHAGLACAIHAIGDRAVRETLDALEARRLSPPDSPRAARSRHRIEHLQLLHPDDLPRLARSGAIASMQPIHATSDLEIAHRHWGAPRVELAYAWRSVLASGAPLCFGSDAPVESLSVLAGIHAAVTRRRHDGTPGPGGFVPTQRLSPREALAAYTIGAATAAGEEDRRGILRAGMLGDATVLSRDILSCPPEALLETLVEATVLDGRLVFQREASVL